MEVKKGYKRTEVGVIPEPWGVALVAEVAERVGSGMTPTGGNRIYQKSGRPFVRSQNVGWGRMDLTEIAYIHDAIHATFAASEIAGGDVLLNITGASIGRASVARPEVVGGNVNQHVCIIRPNSSRLMSSFLCAVLLSALGQSQIDSYQAGGNRQGLNFGQVRRIRLPLPHLAEQTAIAEALSDIDDLIASLERLIAKKRDIKAATMGQLLTGRTRLPGFTGKWERKQFGELAYIRNERIVGDARADALSCVELEHLGQGDGRLLGTTVASAGSSKYRFDEGDVLFGRLRAYLRKHWLARFSGVCSTEIWPLVPRESLVLSSFLLFVVQAESFIEAASMAYGTHMPRADWSVVRRYSVSLPSVPEQAAIAAVLSDMDAEIEALESRLAKTRMLKQGMMQELLTGRTRLV